MQHLQKTGGWGMLWLTGSLLISKFQHAILILKLKVLPRTTIIFALSFHSFTNCPFSIPFVLTFMHRMGGVPLPTSQRSHVSTCRQVTSHGPCNFLSLLRYLLTSLLLGALRASCYTVPLMARQRLGQHFLSDLHWREEIARAIRVSPHSTVPLPQDDKHCWIEIGSGHGEMTEHLLAAGAPVHAIEFDPSLIASLQRLAKKFSNLIVIPGDILEAAGSYLGPRHAPLPRRTRKAPPRR